MTENMKVFLEELSKHEELREKTNQAQTKEEIVEIAKELGVVLTDADFVKEDGQNLSEEELEAVAGGGAKGFCLIIGGGSKDGKGCCCIGCGAAMGLCVLLGA